MGEFAIVFGACVSVFFEFGERHAVDVAPDAVAGLDGGLGASEHPSETVVILQTDWVEFVVVTADAAEGHAEESGADFVHLTVDEIVFHLALIDGVDVDVTEHDEACCDKVLAALFWRVGGEQVAGELFADELVVGFIVIERLDEVIAVAPCVFCEDLAFGTDLLCVADEVEPVAGPSFTECG